MGGMGLCLLGFWGRKPSRSSVVTTTFFEFNFNCLTAAWTHLSRGLSWTYRLSMSSHSCGLVGNARQNHSEIFQLFELSKCPPRVTCPLVENHAADSMAQYAPAK